MLQTSHQQIYEFGSFRIDATKRLLLRDGQVAPLTPKCFDILLALVENSGKVVEKDDLMRRVWPDSFVEEGNLTYNVSILRKALGERAGEHQYIATIPGRGYRFVASVSDLRNEGDKSLVESDSVAVPVVGDHTSTDPLTQGQASPTRPRKITRSYVATLIGLAALAVAVAVLAVKSFWKEPESLERVPIAVVDFANDTGDEELNGLSGLLITSLEQSRRLTVLTRSRMFDILEQMGKQRAERIDESVGREICKRASNAALAIASIRRFDQLYTIDLKILDTERNEYLLTAREEGIGKASIPKMIDSLAERTRLGLREKAAEIQSRKQSVAMVTTDNLEAYRHYFLGEQLARNNLDEAVEEFKKAVALDPTFALAYYQLAYLSASHNLELAKEPIHQAMEHIERAPEKERYMIRAVEAFFDARPSECIKICQDVLELYPTYKEALWVAGDESFHQANYASAINYLQKVLELDPGFGEAVEHIVWVYREAGDYDKMLEYARQYNQKIPDEESYKWLGEAYNLKADFDRTAEVNRRYLVAFPKSFGPIRASGMMHIFKEEYAKAEREFKQLLEASRPLRQRMSGYANLAHLYAYLGKYREAVQMADRALDLSLKAGDADSITEAYVDKAYWLLVGHNEREDAKKALAKAAEINAGANFVYYRLFNMYLLMGEFEKTSPLLKGQLLTMSPFGNRSVSASVHRARGEYEAAINDLETITRLGFVMDRIPRCYELAQCYFETRQSEKAIEAVGKMQRLYSYVYTGGPHIRAAVYPRGFYLLGRIYEQKGDTKLALENYEKFLNLWMGADQDLPEVLDTKSHLARLTAESSGEKLTPKQSTVR